jgi:hypothetical protein
MLLNEYIDKAKFSFLNKYKLRKVTSNIEPLLIKKISDITSNKERIFDKLFNKHGFFIYCLDNAIDFSDSSKRHVSLKIIKALSNESIQLTKVSYPYEKEQEFFDGTTKIKNSQKIDSKAMTSQYMEYHQDGLGNGGEIDVIVLHCDSSSSFGGQNGLVDGIKLFKHLYDVYGEKTNCLFEPDAITIIRRGSRKSLKTVGPVFYTNYDGKPSINFKYPDEKHDVFYSKSCEKIIPSISKWIKTDSNHIKFLLRDNYGIIINNREILHCRYPFLEKFEKQRLLSRSWYTTGNKIDSYGYYPGLFIGDSLMNLLHEEHDLKKVDGYYRYDRQTNRNIKITKVWK